MASIAARLNRLSHRIWREWAAILVTVAMVGFWLLWPRPPLAADEARRLPEAGAAYVRVDWARRSLAMRPDHFAHPADEGFRPRSAILDMPMVGRPALRPSPVYLPSPPFHPAPSATVVPPPPLSVLAGPDYRELLIPAPPPMTGAVVRLSAVLRRAAFVFTPPPTNAAPLRLRVAVVVGGDGRVAHALLEEGAASDAARAWLEALSRGRAEGPVRGLVEIESSR